MLTFANKKNTKYTWGWWKRRTKLAPNFAAIHPTAPDTFQLMVMLCEPLNLQVVLDEMSRGHHSHKASSSGITLESEPKYWPDWQTVLLARFPRSVNPCHLRNTFFTFSIEKTEKGTKDLPEMSVRFVFSPSCLACCGSPVVVHTSPLAAWNKQAVLFSFKWKLLSPG